MNRRSHQAARRGAGSGALAQALPDGALENIPQARDLGALFQELPTQRAQAKPGDGLLVCRAELNPKYGGDFFSAPDLGAVLRFAGQVLFYSGPGESRTGFLSLPKLEVAVGQDLEVEFIDFDLMHDDYLGQFGLPFDGMLPVSIQHPTMKHRLDCRFLDAQGVSKRSKPLLVQAKRAARLVRKAQPTQRLPELGYGKTRLREAWAKLDDVAAYTGWGHPELDALAAKVADRDAAWFNAAEAYMAERLAKLPGPPQARVKTTAVQAWEPRVTCTPGSVRTSCELQLYVLRTSKKLPRGIKFLDAQGLEYAASPQTQALAPEAGDAPGFVRERWTFSVPAGRPVGSYSGEPGANPGSRVKALQVCPQRPACWLRID